MVLVLRVLVYEFALALVLVALPLWLALGVGAPLGILPELLQLPGLVLATAGATLWLWAIAVLVAEGAGTPLPLDPPRRLVVTGPYAWIRNPMHAGLALFLVGIGFLFRSPTFLMYSAVVALLEWGYARWLEEPGLAERYGDPYRVYRARTPAWWPRRSGGPPATRAPSLQSRDTYVSDRN